VNQKHRKPNRLKEYDYSQGGYYFVTICTKDKTDYFGKIEDGNVFLNEYGNIVHVQWLWLEKQYEYVKLDEFIIMPNHFHGILIIEDGGFESVVTGRDLSLQPKRKTKPLSGLIGAFKTVSSKMIHRNGSLDFAWQRSFYDHIIRNERSLDEIREYIQNNPMRWELDRGNLENLHL
jgi:REP element-mobilizing transposase RayT